MTSIATSSTITKKGISLSEPTLENSAIIPSGATGDGRFTHDCAHRVVNDRNAEYDPLDRVPPSPLVEMLMEKGREHENAVFEQLEIIHDVVRISSFGSLDERVAATADKMRRGEKVVLGGALPDVDGRSGRPDVLLRVDSPSSLGAWSYVPCDVKSHDAFDGESKAREWLIGSLAMPLLHEADACPMVGKPVKNDSLQLAHYWRMLEGLGLAPSNPESGPESGPVGAIIDKNQLVVWRRLDDALWRHEDPWSGAVADRSALSILDLEWNYRWSAINAMLAGQPCTEPLWYSACGTCEWKNVCYSELEADQHVSLIAGVTRDTTKRLAAIGVRTMPQLAALDIRTAEVVVATHGSCNLAELVDRTNEFSSTDEPVGVLFTARQTKGPNALAAAGIRTLADLLALDQDLIRIKSSTDLVRAIDAARVRLHPDGLPHLPRGVARQDVVVPRADIEVDVDMENSDEVYLWGTFTSMNDGVSLPPGFAAGYLPFHYLNVADDLNASSCTTGARPIEGIRTEADVFADWWEWMHRLIAAAGEQGRTVKFYCYTDAEYRKMREVVNRWPTDPRLPSLDEIDDFVRSEHWVDLKKTVEAFIWPTDSMGLKSVAPLAGFEWRAEDAGGDNSMLWFEIAVSDPDVGRRHAMARKLLEYNEDDVQATKVLRNWLDDGLQSRGFTIGNVSELDG